MNPARVYAVGDIHGRLDLLRAVHDAIADDLAARPAPSHAVAHIGDYTDRGVDSSGVIGFLIDGEARAEPWINLCGNHDRMFLRFLETPGGRDPMLRAELGWLHSRLGGRDTLRSYGLDIPETADMDGAAHWRAARDAVPEAHVAFLERLRPCWRWGGFFFAHAGVKPGVPLDDQSEDDLAWIRQPFLESRLDHGAVVVHGHTPVETVEHHGNRIAIDTGAAYGGPLSCVALEGDRARVLGASADLRG